MQSVVNFLASVWSFFTGLIENLLLFFKYLLTIVNVSSDLIFNMPDFLQTFAFITLTVSVLYLILGRTTGGQKE